MYYTGIQWQMNAEEDKMTSNKDYNITLLLLTFIDLLYFTFIVDSKFFNSLISTKQNTLYK